MSTPLKSARAIQQKLLSCKESIRSILSYGSRRKEDSVYSDKELGKQLKQLDKDLGRLLEYVQRLESKSRKSLREERSERAKKKTPKKTK